MQVSMVTLKVATTKDLGTKKLIRRAKGLRTGSSQKGVTVAARAEKKLVEC